MNIVFLGSPGSGKGTQSKFLSKDFGLNLVGMGDILRGEVLRKTEIGLRVKEKIESGSFPDNDLIRSVLEKHLKQFISRGFLFDGIPRDIVQAHFLDEILNEYSERVDLAIHLSLPEKNAFKRILGRYSCAECGNIVSRCDDTSNIGVCSCGSRNFVRRKDDDSEEIIKERFLLYKERESFVLEHYAKEEILHVVDSSQEVMDVRNRLFEIIRNAKS